MSARVWTSPASRRGFSLLELLVAIGLLAVLIGAVYAFITTLFARETRALDEAARSQTALMVFDRLESDLMGAIATGPSGRTGLSGTREQLTVAHRSVLPGSASAPWSDAQWTTIRFDRRRGRISIERRDGEAESPGEPTPYPVPVRAARFRYYDGSGWRESFNSARGLPVAVELALWFGEVAVEDDALPLEDERGLDGDGRVRGFEPDEPFDPSAMSLEELARMTGGFGGDGDAPDPELELEDLGQPDRVRLITIPDARVPRMVRRASGPSFSAGGVP